MVSPLVILHFILICVTLHCNNLAAAKMNPRPNIVLILTDDLDVSIGGMVSTFSEKRVLIVAILSGRDFLHAFYFKYCCGVNELHHHYLDILQCTDPFSED